MTQGEKGILTKDDQKWLRKVLDAVTFKKGFMDLIDGPLYGLLITVADDYVIEKYVAQGQRNVIKEAIELAKDNNAEALNELVLNRLNLDGLFLRNIGEQAVNFVLTAIVEYVEDVELNIEEDE